MDKKLSRRGFIKKSALALGAFTVCDVAGMALSGKGVALASGGLKGSDMSHVSVKLFPGRSEKTKQRLAEAIAGQVVDIIGCDETSVSITIEDVSSGDWKDEVYEPLIQGKKETLYKKPGYSL